MPGLNAQIGVAAETTVGTIVAPTRFYEFTSETLELKKSIVQGQGLRAGVMGARASRRAFTGRDVNGGIVMDFPTKGAGLLLQQMLGSSATATQQGATAAYLQTHVAGTVNGKSLTIQKGVQEESTGTIQPFTYNGCKVTDWSLDVKVDGILTTALTIDAWNETTATPLATASYIAGSGVFNFSQGSLSLGGTATTTAGVTSVTGGTQVASVKGCSIKGKNALRQDRKFLGSAGIKAEQRENGYRSYTGQMDAEFVTRAAMYDAFASDSGMVMELKFVGPLIASTYYYTLDVILPAVYLDGESPKVSGPDIQGQTCGFTALVDAAGNPQIQISYTSTDVAV